MAGASQSIAIDDLGLAAGLDRLVALVENPEPMLDEIGDAMVQRTQERFELGVAPGGLPWLPSIRAQRTGGKTMRDSGELMRSLTHLVGPGYVEWGTNKIYAGVHQHGATIRAKAAGALVFEIPGVGWITKKEVTIPQRQFLGIDERDKEAIGEILVHWLEEAARGQGGGPA